MALLEQREARQAGDGEGEAQEQFMAYDLGRLAAFNTTPVPKMNMTDGKVMGERARESIQFIVNRLFALPSERAQFGRLASLPAPTTVVPREKPVPKPKPLTRWESYAKEKGIQKKKKERMKFDERAGEFRPIWGYKKAGADDGPPIMEAGQGDDGSVDPFERKKEEKKDRLKKQSNREKRNAEEAGGKAHLPISEQPTRNEKRVQSKAALALARTATASAGKFDAKLKNDTKAKVKRKLEQVSTAAGSEKSRNMELLSRIVGSNDGATLDMDKAANAGLRLGSVSFTSEEQPRKKAKAGSSGKKVKGGGKKKGGK